MPVDFIVEVFLLLPIFGVYQIRETRKIMSLSLVGVEAICFPGWLGQEAVRVTAYLGL